MLTSATGPVTLRLPLLLLALIALFQAAPAQACPAGQQPITQMMPRNVAGPHGGDSWVPTTICIPATGGDLPYGSGGGDGRYDEGPRYVHTVNNNGALAFGVTAAGEPHYNFSRWGSSKPDRAQADAVDICNKAGIRDCDAALWCTNCHISIARDGNGALRAAFGATKKKAERAVNQACRAAKASCKIIETRDFLSYGVITNYR